MFAILILASQNIMFLYTRLKFNWTQLEFSEFTAAAASVAALGSVIVLPLLVK